VTSIVTVSDIKYNEVGIEESYSRLEETKSKDEMLDTWSMLEYSVDKFDFRSRNKIYTTNVLMRKMKI
jgi:hypothetical protein